MGNRIGKIRIKHIGDFVVAKLWVLIMTGLKGPGRRDLNTFPYFIQHPRFAAFTGEFSFPQFALDLILLAPIDLQRCSP
jgi:hypothetical protein